MTFVFLGTMSEVSGLPKLERFGQTFEVTEAEAQSLIVGAGPDTGFAGGLPAIPEADFAAIGFTADELERYGEPGPREMAPPDFRAKYQTALVRLHEYRMEVSVNG